MAQSRKEELIREIRQQREDLSARCENLRQELEPGRQIRLSLHKHPLRWALSAGGTAFLLARLVRRRPVVCSKHRRRGGLLFGTARLAFNLARPTLTAMALKKLQQQLESRFHPNPGNSMLGGPLQK
jgi:hypothetical protein